MKIATFSGLYVLAKTEILEIFENSNIFCQDGTDCCYFQRFLVASLEVASLEVASLELASLEVASLELASLEAPGSQEEPRRARSSQEATRSHQEATWLLLLPPGSSWLLLAP